MTTISRKMGYRRIDGWRGFEQPINAICGANDTGSFSDSPCPSHQRKAEISLAKKVLKQAGIKVVTMWGKSSNVFCSSQYVLVAPPDRDKAKEVLTPLMSDTRLLYLCATLSE